MENQLRQQVPTRVTGFFSRKDMGGFPDELIKDELAKAKENVEAAKNARIGAQDLIQQAKEHRAAAEKNIEKVEQLKEAFNVRMPYVGEIVLFTARPDDEVAHSNHNSEPIPAIVTRVWSSVCVNLKIIPDCGAMQDRTSVVHKSANPATYHFEFIN